MDRNDRIRAQQRALAAAESSGLVADSLDVRMALIERQKSGEITFTQMQAELKRIKRTAHKHGQVTRSEAYNGHLPEETP